MAEDLDQNLDQIKELLSSSNLSEADVQLLMNRLTPVYKDGSISIGGNVTDSVLIPGDNNQVTVNKGTDPTELLDELNRIIGENKGANRRELLDKLNHTLDEVESAQQRPVRCKTRSMLIASVSIAAIVGVMRLMAVLQGFELAAFDGLMASQKPFAQEDPHFLVIAPNDEEVEQQGEDINTYGVSFTDQRLADVLKKVQKLYHPTVIGLDLQRNFKAKPELAPIFNPSLAPQHVAPPIAQQTQRISKKGVAKKGSSKPNKLVVKNDQGNAAISHSPVVKPSASPIALNLVGGCKVLETEEGENGTRTIKGTEIAPPPELSQDKVGFTDFKTGVGNQGISRRQILAQKPPDGSNTCKTQLAFSTQIASQFLSQKEGFNKPEPNPEEESCLRFSKPDAASGFSFPLFNPFMGGFQGGADRNAGCEMILNYGVKKIKIIRLKDLDEAAKNQSGSPEDQSNLREIVLIGSGARKQKDIWLTPLGEMEGVMIQALTTSQIIDVVLGKQRLIWVLPEWADFLWTLGWSLLGGLLGWRLPFWKVWLLSLVAAIAVLYLICGLGFWLWQLWLPFIPPLIALPASASGVAYLNFRRKFGTNNPFEILRAVLNESK